MAANCGNSTVVSPMAARMPASSVALPGTSRTSPELCVASARSVSPRALAYGLRGSRHPGMIAPTSVSRPCGSRPRSRSWNSIVLVKTFVLLAIM